MSKQSTKLNIVNDKNITDELKKSVALLIRRDMELAQIRQEQQGRIGELKKITKALIQRDFELNQIKLLLQDALTKSDIARLELEREKNKVEAIINSLNDGLIVVDDQMKIIFANRRLEMFCGIKFQELQYKPIDVFAAHPAMGPVFRLIRMIIDERAENENRKEVILSYPQERVLQVTVSYLIDQLGNVLGFIISLHDISREKLIERMKSEFVSITAHQLRTPLSAIKWVLKMILEGDEGPLSLGQKKLLEQGYESNERMIALINDLLNLTRLEEGRFLYKFSSVSLIDLISQAVINFLPMTKKSGVELIFEQPKEKVPNIEVDVEKLQLVFQNLLDNAIRYTPAGGKVTISIRPDKLYIEVAVKDTGIGIPKDKQSRIFDKFFRADNAVKLQTEGSGLGLFIAKNIIEKHGGSVWFESEESKGSAFYFRIPYDSKIET